jgi:TonB-linked SusC/RagA family outer membrane protein
LYLNNGNLNWQPLNGTATWSNPIASTLNYAKAITNNLISNLNVGYMILPGLQLRSSFGYSHTQMNATNLSTSSAVAPPYNTNPAVRQNQTSTSDFQTWIIEPQLDYQKRIARGQLNVLIGSTFQQNTQTQYTNAYIGFSSDALISDPSAATTQLLDGYSTTLYHYNAIFGRIGYTWDDKYLLNVTARRDGSSRFGPGNQFGNFGAVGAGWIFSHEKSIQDHLPFMSFGKLRGSYGTTGNDQITDYQFLSTYTPYSYSYETLTGLYPTRIPNPYFGWEEVKKLEGGLELGFLKDRLLISGSYYRDRTGNQLVGYPLPSLSGFSSVQANLHAIVQNSGAEIVLNTTNIKSKIFTWTSAVNVSVPRNKLVAYPNLASSSYANSYVVGQSLFIRKVYHYLGVNDTTGTYQYQSKDGPTDKPSSPGDYVTSKPVTQSFYGGFENTFKYKGFQLDILIQFVKQQGFNYYRYSGYQAGLFNENALTQVLARWQKSGDISNFGRYSTNYGADPYGDLRNSDFPITDASFIRFKNLAFSYELPKPWQKAVHLHNGRVYLQCQNLLTITKFTGLDPETGGSLGLPPLRMITGGLQVAL